MRHLTLLLLVFLAGCAAPKPMVDFDPSHNFSEYRTFAFISDNPLMIAEGLPGVSPMLEGRIIQITENILSARGYTRVSDRKEANFTVGFTLGGRDKIQVTSYPESYRGNYGSWGWGGRGYYGAQTYTNTDVRQYTEGTLAVDLYDGSTRKPVWHARAVRKITTKMRENPGETLRAILGDMFAAFPPS
ncbi:MAG: DUF4136 domain-containing protein [Gammaproteobacteria bacterium]|jgi:hypothetical protein|nr:DUF4136 domain-containing protein [Gammaproteobacteria bacterium]MBT3866284.1 DUF4136 domain-containing protein [Gammaproteobacteria bacterium]MBT4379292.1 DUF4136 domain-containing protein [Gammaproteobacteria bacterium]MBT4615403.1 DUF4136 domain-containing protein [Gammaproteobacteria bacterium]MBT5200000.1 DUF4136 domain-containing protein [Gammaproteobacteria bacterium]